MLNALCLILSQVLYHSTYYDINRQYEKNAFELLNSGLTALGQEIASSLQTVALGDKETIFCPLCIKPTKGTLAFR